MPTTLRGFAELARRQFPLVELDTTGLVVEHVADGLALRTDPEAQRRAARKAALLVAAFFGLFALVPTLWARLVFGGVALALVVLAFVVRPKPFTGRVAFDGIEAGVEGKPPERVAAADVREVVLERHEYETHSGKHRRTVVEWPVRLALVSGETRVLAKSNDRAKARRFAEDVAIVWQRPFVDATGATRTVVASEAVNLGLVERLRRGLLEAPDPGPPPAGVEVRDVAGGYEFAVRRRRWGHLVGFAFTGLWFAGIGGLMTAISVALAFAPEGSPWLGLVAIFPFLFFLVGCGMIVAAVASVTGEEFLRVTRDGLVKGSRRFGRERATAVSPEGFEDLRAVKGVVLVADEREEHLGFGNAKAEQQAWIAAAALAALADRA